MTSFSRRRFLQASGAVALGAGLGVGTAGCGSGSGSGTTGTLTWWDHQNQLEPAKRAIFKKFAGDPGGMPVNYTFNNPEKLGQALQLAKQGNQLPDVHSNAGLQVPVPQLIQGGWAGPLHLSDTAMANLKDALLDGIHIFDGKVYAFPIFDYHVYSNVTWFNTTIVERAGLDPANPPSGYDDFRAAARAVKKNGGTTGWVWNIGMPIRTQEQVNFLAQAAGFEGADGQLFRTGEFAYDHDAYLTVLDFLLSLKKDGVMTPGCESWVDSTARSRWSAGAACYYFDGPWCPGVVLKDTPAFGDKLGVGPILTPDRGAAVRTYHGPQGGDYWLTPTTRYADAANQLLSDYFTTPEYSIEVANTMSQPPRDLDAVDKSSAHPQYKKLIGWYRDTVFLAPSAVVKNVEVTKAQAESKQVQPTLGAIIQGAFTGDVPDVKKALKKLTDDSNAERDRAVKAAQAKGAQVSVDDYAFPDWQPGADYTLDRYH